MKKNYIVKSTYLLGLVLLSLAACTKREHASADNQETEVLADTGIRHLLKPVNEHIVSSLPVIEAQTGPRVLNVAVEGAVNFDTRNERSLSSKVSGRVERLYIKYNYQPVKKGQIIMEIYSPDLVTAQRELLMISRSTEAGAMLPAATQRLQLLGMTAGQIARLLQTKQVQYRVPVYSNAGGYILERSQQRSSGLASPASAPVASSDGMAGMGTATTTPSASSSDMQPPANSPLLLREGQYVNAGQSLFTIYQAGGVVAELYLKPDLAASIKRGSAVLIEDGMQSGKLVPGSIGLIQPVINEGERFTLARVYLKDKSFRAGQLIKAHIPLVVQNSWWLPEEAVLSLGNSSVVFRKDTRTFVPAEVKTGLQANGKVQILSDISGWQVAGNAYYLTDRESFINVKKNTDL